MIKLYRYDISAMTDEQYAQLAARHSAALGARLSRMAHLQDRKRSLAGHLLILQAAEELCGATDPVLLRTPQGKPYFADLPIRFSLSHSGERVILAVSQKEIGADVEQILPRSLAPAKRFFTAREQAYVFSAAGDDALLRFYEVWTKKEAYGKWQGSGIDAARAADTTALSFYTENDGGYILAVYEE